MLPQRLGAFLGASKRSFGAPMLSEMAVRQAKAKDKDYKLSDSEGIYLFVAKICSWPNLAVEAGVSNIASRGKSDG